MRLCFNGHAMRVTFLGGIGWKGPITCSVCEKKTDYAIMVCKQR